MTVPFTTTFLLLRSRSPSPPTITDNNSKPAQCFNSTLRSIADRTGFHSLVFGRPHQGSSEPATLAGWFTDVPFDLLALFINWNDNASANGFLQPAVLSQTFEELSTWYEAPQNMTVMGPSPSLQPPIAIALNWSHGDASKVLNRINVPMEVSLATPSSSDLGTFVSSLNADGKLANELLPEKFAAARVGVDASAKDVERLAMCVRARYEGSAREALSEVPHETITLSLMRAKYCSRVRADMIETIKSRRAD